MSDWIYPYKIAHRGAGLLAPENTLAAFKLGASHGYRMFECDVKLSSDGVPFLLHDDTLDRTTNGCGVAGQLDWAALQKLDAGSWHSAAYAAEPLPSLETIANFCIANDLDLNIEIKPTTGFEKITGKVVAEYAARLWHGKTRKPLLSSFQPDTLQAALEAAPELPRGALLSKLWPVWLETSLRLRCHAVIFEQDLWDASSMALAKGAGFKTLSFTVNDEQQVQRLEALGIDGIITDRVDVFKP